MKSVVAFGSGALTLFGGMSLLSLVMFLRQIGNESVSEQLLIVASLVSPALILSAVCAASYWLGLKVNAHRGSPNAFVIGLLCALVVYLGLVVVHLVGIELSPHVHVVAQVLLASLVCLLAAAAFAAPRG